MRKINEENFHVSVRQDKEEAVKRIEQYLIESAEKARWVALVIMLAHLIDDKNIA